MSDRPDSELRRVDPGSGPSAVVGTVGVTAIIVTRGDHELGQIIDSVPEGCEVIVWDNGAKRASSFIARSPEVPIDFEVDDLAVYGRYAAIEYASNPLIFVQDDDCVLPRESIEEIVWQSDSGSSAYGQLVCNMPSRFRHGFYDEHALVGFGACFHRDLPEMAFRQWDFLPIGTEGLGSDTDFFHRTCDVFFTALTPYTLVDVPYENLPWAEGDDRMYRKPGHQAERSKMLELAFRVKDVADD